MKHKTYQCAAISLSDREDIDSFTVLPYEGEGLLNYLQSCALQDEEEHLARTYIVRDCKTDEMVAYFSLKAGMMTVFPPVRNVLNLFVRNFDVVPGIELSNFAVNASYKEAHAEVKGLGVVIFWQYILPLCRKTAEIVGAKVIYIFALPQRSLIRYYQNKLHFSRLNMLSELKTHRKIKPNYDRHCIFMYRSIEEA